MLNELDDINHYVWLSRLEGKGKHQLLSHCVIDILRKHYGLKRTVKDKELVLKDTRFKYILMGSNIKEIDC